MKADLYTAQARTAGVGGLAHRTAAGFVVLTSADGDDIIALIDEKQNESDLIDHVVAMAQTSGPEAFAMLFTAGGEMYVLASGTARVGMASPSQHLSMRPVGDQVLVHALNAGLNETAATVRLHLDDIASGASTDLELRAGTVDASWIEIAIGGAVIATPVADESEAPPKNAPLDETPETATVPSDPPADDPIPSVEPVAIIPPTAAEIPFSDDDQTVHAQTATAGPQSDAPAAEATPIPEPPDPAETPLPTAPPEPAAAEPAETPLPTAPPIATTTPEPPEPAEASVPTDPPIATTPAEAATPEPTPAHEPAETAAAADPPLAVATPPAAPALADVSPETPAEADSPIAAATPEPAATPTTELAPTTGVAPADAPAAGKVGAVMVLGVNCSQGHHNHPDAVYCSQCGTKMGVHHTTVLINGPRPPLGVLVVDDGSTYSLNEDLVIGREPTSHEDVVAGAASPMILTDDTLSLSRKHARIVLEDWSVAVQDLNSSNGTFLSRAGQSEPWVKIESGSTMALEPSDRLRVGGRIIQVELHHVG